MRLVLAAAAAIALVALVACGDGDGDNGSDGEELSREDYAAEVRDILEPLGDELTDIGGVVGGSETPEELADSLQTAEGEIADAVDDLEALQPPSELEGAHQALIDALETFNEGLMELSDAAETSDVAEILDAARRLPSAIEELEGELDQIREELRDAGVELDLGN